MVVQRSVGSHLNKSLGRNDVTKTRPGCQDSFKMVASEVAAFETNFFRIVGTSEAETSLSGKAECLLAIGEDKKVSFLERPPLSIKAFRNFMQE